MFLKSIHKYCKAEKKGVMYYRLCESYRDEYGTPKQRMVIGLGRLDELASTEQKLLLVERINELMKGSPTLFNTGSNNEVDRLAYHFYEQIRIKNKVDKPVPMLKEIETIRVNSLKNKRNRVRIIMLPGIPAIRNRHLPNPSWLEPGSGEPGRNAYRQPGSLSGIRT